MEQYRYFDYSQYQDNLGGILNRGKVKHHWVDTEDEFRLVLDQEVDKDWRREIITKTVHYKSTRYLPRLRQVKFYS